jgi:hypothetical protein
VAENIREDVAGANRDKIDLIEQQPTTLERADSGA